MCVPKTTNKKTPQRVIYNRPILANRVFIHLDSHHRHIKNCAAGNHCRFIRFPLDAVFNDYIPQR